MISAIVLILISNFLILSLGKDDFCPVKKWYELNEDKFPKDKCLIFDKSYEERKNLFYKICSLSNKEYKLTSNIILNKVDNFKFLVFYFSNLEKVLPYDLLTCFSRIKKNHLKSNINERIKKIFGNNLVFFTMIKTINSILSSIMFLVISSVIFVESLISNLVQKLKNMF
jgi:hypothetical protein